jgi:hypothetical protein
MKQRVHVRLHGNGECGEGIDLVDGDRGRDCGSEADSDIVLCSVFLHKVAPVCSQTPRSHVSLVEVFYSHG